MSRKNKSTSPVKIIAVGVLLLSGLFGVSELYFALFCEKTEGGDTLIFDQIVLTPRTRPFQSLRDQYKLYPSKKNKTTVHDPDLGWVHTSFSRLDINEAGIRATQNYGMQPSDHAFRIAIFGDAFTFGKDVAYEQTWGFITEKLLNETLPPNVRIEVLNFGVDGYGMDQAYLRWKKTGRHYNPHLVIFGFQPENAGRNVNLLPLIYQPSTSIPFLKPRYIFKPKGNVELVNVPVPSPEVLLSQHKRFKSWEWSKHEYHYYPGDYSSKSWKQVRTLSFIASLYNHWRRQEEFFLLSKEPAQLAIKIIQMFEEDVRKTRTDFLMVHLPNASSLSELMDQKNPYKDFLNEVKKIAPMIHPEQELLQAARKKNLGKIIQTHYTAEGHQIIGQIVSESIQAFLVNKQKLRKEM